MTYVKRFLIGAFIFAMICSGAAYALPVDFGSSTLNAFNATVATDVHNFVNDPSLALYQIAWIEWVFFTVLIISGRAYGWALGSSNVVDLITGAMMILGVAMVLTNYDTVTTAFWSYSDLGVSYQEAVIGHGGDPMWPAAELQNIIENVKLVDVDIFSPIRMIFWSAVYVIISLLTSIAFYISSAWSVFGYGLAKILGFALVPFIMSEWTRGVFDGWVRLFMGFLFYNIISRIIMVMLIRFLENAIGAAPEVINPDDNFGSYIGVVAMFAMGLLFLFSAAGFSAILAGGFTSANAAGNSVTRAVATVAKLFI